MKKVILNEPKTTPIEKVDHNRFFYGASVDGAKHLIFRTDRGYYSTLNTHKLPGTFDGAFIEVVIRSIVSRGGDVFEFETGKELFKWLSE